MPSESPPSSTLSDRPPPYERVIGRYALCPPFARGGMATVHLARQVSDEGFSRVVAVKRLHAHFAESTEWLGMFLDEARVAGRIRHANVVPTLDVVSREGELLIVMEYVLGQTLSELTREVAKAGQRVPIGIALRIAIDMLHGLHAAHEATDERGRPLGIVHRDVSPQNVLVGVDGVARIVDFGIAKATGRMQTTRNNKLKGKIAYMAPEQLGRRDGLDGRVDLYAAAIVLWELLTMKRLFRGEDEVQTFHKALNDHVHPPSSLNPSIPLELDDVVMHGLRRERDQRAQTARELAIELESLQLAAPSAEVADWVERVASPALQAAKASFSALERAPAPTSVEDQGTSPSWSEGTVRSRVQKAIADAEEPTNLMHEPRDRVPPSSTTRAELPLVVPEEGTATGMTFPETTHHPAQRRRLLWWAAAALLLLLGLGVVQLTQSAGGPSGERVEGAANESPPATEAGRSVQEQPRAPGSTDGMMAAESASTPSAAESPPKPTRLDDLPPEDEAGTPSPEEDSAQTTQRPAPTQAAPVQPRPRPRVAPKPRPVTNDCAVPFTIDESGVKVPKMHCL